MNLIDVFFILIIIAFALIASVKGFIREAFGKLCFIGALFVSIMAAPQVVTLLAGAISNNILRIILAYLIVYIVSFLALRLIQGILEGIFENYLLSGLNRALGFFLGLAEGFVIILFVMAIMSIQTFFDISDITRGSIFFNTFAPFLNYTTKKVAGTAA